MERRARRAMGYSEPYCTYIVYYRDYINLFLVLDYISNLETTGNFRKFRLIFHFRNVFEFFLSLGGECLRVDIGDGRHGFLACGDARADRTRMLCAEWKVYCVMCAQG